MTKKSRKLIIFGLLLPGSIAILALGVKYFPLNKLKKMVAGPEQGYVNPKKTNILPPNTLYYDFELAPGTEMPAGFYKGLAHSGQYSVKAFGENSFSVPVKRTAKEVGVQNLKAVAFSAWVYVFPTKNEVKGNLVFTASDASGKNVCWQGISVVEPEVPRGKWFKVSKYLDLTSVAFKPEYLIEVYFWNTSSTDILIDDYTVVFGGQVERRGDSAYTDMTKPDGFTQRFNYPPFPVSFLEKENAASKPKIAGLTTSDKVVAGNFLNAANDALFVIGQDGRPAVYAYCPANREFSKITLNNQAVIAPVQPVKKIMKGRFTGGQGEQILVCGEKGWMLCSPGPVNEICNTSGALQTDLKILWKSDVAAPSIFCGDFNGDQRTEILQIENNGSWKVMAFESTEGHAGNWKEIAGDQQNPVKEWNKNDQEIGITVGKFVPGLANDQVLTVIKGMRDTKYGYTLLKLNSSRMRWDPLLGEKQAGFGKTIGIDTLKPSDLIFTARDGNELKVYRYNRDWRFDLKEIRFNDSTFRIISSVDFQGFSMDQNPKYYESLTLIPGNFLDASSSSILTIGCVAKERHYDAILPDFVHLYAFPSKK